MREDTQVVDEEVAKKNRTQVIILLVALPLISVFAVYSLVWLANRDTLLQTTNRGDFVDPPVLARELGLRDASGTTVDGRGSWWVWLVTPGCGAACERSLREMQALRQRLSEQAQDLRAAPQDLHPASQGVRFALVTGRNPGSLPPAGRYPRTLRFTSDGEKSLEDGIYLVDAAGNVVLRYPADSPAQPMLEDLVRLLEVPADV